MPGAPWLKAKVCGRDVHHFRRLAVHPAALSNTAHALLQVRIAGIAQGLPIPAERLARHDRHASREEVRELRAINPRSALCIAACLAGADSRTGALLDSLGFLFSPQGRLALLWGGL